MGELNFLPILAVIILFATFDIFLYFNLDLLQPVVSFFSVMFFSVLLGVLNIQRWGLSVGPDTTLIVLGGMFSFAAGAIFIHYCFYDGRLYSTYRPHIIGNNMGVYQIPVWITVFASLFILQLAYFSATEMYAMSLTLGNHDGVLNMIKTLRYPLERGEIHFSRWINYRELISMVFATSFLYFFINNLIVRKKILKVDFILLLPVISEFPFFIMSTGRRSIVHFVICGLILAGILYQRKYGVTHYVRTKILKLLGVTALFSLVFYFVLGFFTGKVSIGGRSPLTIISHYGGLSIPALEQYVSAVHVENQYFLQNTMMGLYGNLNSIGFHLEEGQPFLPFVNFQGNEHINTNVYTVFYRLLADYSFPGLIIIMFLFGMLLTFTYDYLKHHDTPCILIIYSFFGYIPFFLFIDDQFMGIFRSRTIYFCIFLSVFVKALRHLYFFRKSGNSQ